MQTQLSHPGRSRACEYENVSARRDVTTESALHQAAHVHDLLACCGFRADDNGAVASRVRFNRTAQDWAVGIGRWAGDPTADRGVVMIDLLADAVPRR